jgi:DNA-directed RNA polymerase specialized sigma24 family protein
MILRYYLDLSESDIADTLGIAPGSVKSHAHRALAKLQAQLEDDR